MTEFCLLWLNVLADILRLVVLGLRAKKFDASKPFGFFVGGLIEEARRHSLAWRATCNQLVPRRCFEEGTVARTFELADRHRR